MYTVQYVVGNAGGGSNTKSVHTTTYMLKKVHGGSDVGKTVWFSAAAPAVPQTHRDSSHLNTRRNEIQGVRTKNRTVFAIAFYKNSGFN